ncbi:MAG TPA: response regulator [Thermoanaerobaculia bacterium]|nr:response regulator [Thermoanaerobaculia bacterium]
MPDKRPSILVVDDDQPILLLMKNILTEFHFEARTAGSGVEAIEAVRTAMPDLILLDMNMPGMAGDEVLRQIRQEDGVADVPVLILSGEPVSEEELAELGVRGAVIKPFDLQKLLATIRGLVDG